MKKIAVLGANPAYQKTLFFKEFNYGEINRACRMETFPAGKGINFCRAAAIWGKSDTVLCQFTGGENGRRISGELAEEKITCINIQTSGATRCCVTCLDESRRIMTEIIEPSSAVTPPEAEDMLNNFRREVTGAAAAAICGSLPDGSDYRLYGDAAEIAHRAGVPLLFDAWKELDNALLTGNNLLKINREELAKLSGTPDLRQGLRKLFQQFQLDFAAITDGASQAFASDGKLFFTYTIPYVENVVNPIGCGDTASAVMLSEIVSGTSPAEAFHLALCAASANCMNSFPGNFVKHDAEKFAASTTFKSEPL